MQDKFDGTYVMDDWALLVCSACQHLEIQEISCLILGMIIIWRQVDQISVSQFFSNKIISTVAAITYCQTSRLTIMIPFSRPAE